MELRTTSMVRLTSWMREAISGSGDSSASINKNGFLERSDLWRSWLMAARNWVSGGGESLVKHARAERSPRFERMLRDVSRVDVIWYVSYGSIPRGHAVH